MAITAALHGAGGYGKTTLAKALAHDEDIIEAYFDGILWVELGEEPGNVAFHRLRPDRNAHRRTAYAGKPERRRLEARRSVGRAAHPAYHRRRLARAGFAAVPARRAEHHAAYHHALRSRGADGRLLSAGRRHVSQAILPFARLGLARRRGAQFGGWIERARGAARASGLTDQAREWLFGLEAQPARRAARTGYPQRQRSLDVKGLLAFDAAREGDRAKAVALTMSVSLDLLDGAQQQRFEELAVFPEDTDIPLGVVSRLWRMSSGVGTRWPRKISLSELFGLSLLLGLDLERRTVRLHDAVRHFLQDQAGVVFGLVT